MSKADTRVDDLRKAILQLSEWMEQDPKLDMMHQLAIENGIQMLQIVYLSWKKRTGPNPSRQKSAITDVFLLVAMVVATIQIAGFVRFSLFPQK